MIESLDVVYNIMENEKSTVEKVYPSSDYIVNSTTEFGLVPSDLSKAAAIVSYIFANLTGNNTHSWAVLSSTQTKQISEIISVLGLAQVKAKFPSAAESYETVTDMFRVVTRRIALADIRGLNMNGSAANVLFPATGLDFAGVQSTDYDVVFAEIAATLYPGADHEPLSEVVRIVLFNASSDRASTGNASVPVRVRGCVPITIQYTNVSIVTAKATPACAWYNESTNAYIMNDTGVTMRKYRQKYREISCELTHLTDFVVLEKLPRSTHVVLYVLATVVLCSVLVQAWAMLAVRLSIYDRITLEPEKKPSVPEPTPQVQIEADRKSSSTGEVPIDPFSTVAVVKPPTPQKRKEEVAPQPEENCKKVKVDLEEEIRKRPVSTFAAYTLLWEIYMVRMIRCEMG